MQTNGSKDGQRGASTTPPQTTNQASEPTRSKVKKSWFVVGTVTPLIKEFEKKPAMFKWLNDDPEAPKYGSYRIIAGAEVLLRQTVALG